MKMIHSIYHSQNFSKPLLALVLLILIVVGPISFAAQRSAIGQRSSPRLYDPLSEMEHAIGLRQLDELVASSQVNAARMERQVVLLFERHDAPKVQRGSAHDKTRQGEGYIYNYDANTLQRIIIDLASGSQKVMETIQDVQLPLIQEEKARTLALIQADRDAWGIIGRQFQTMTGQPLTDIAQLNTKILIFRADAMPNRVNAASSLCGRHRCAQVLLFTDDQFAFEITPIVDLSTEIITQLRWEE